MGIFFAKPVEQDHVWPVTTSPTASSVNVAFPAANLLTYDPTMVFKSSGTGTTITWDLGRVRRFDIVALVHTNLSILATMSIQASLDNVSWTTLRPSARALAHIVGTPAAGTSESDADIRKSSLLVNHTLYNSPTVREFRYLQITIASGDATIPSIGRLFVGRKFVPSTGWQYGSSFDFMDMSKRDRTDQGALILKHQKPIVVANVKMDFLSKNEMYDFIYDFNYWRGSAREILACLDTDDIPRLQKNILYGTISEGRRVSFDSYNTHSATWIVESMA